MLKTIAPTLRRLLTLVLFHVRLALIAGALLGLVEALIWTRGDGVPSWLALTLGAALGAHLAAPVGVVQAAFVHACRWAGHKLGMWEALARMTNGDRAAPREPIVVLHASVMAVVVAGLLVLAGLWVVLEDVFNVTDVALARKLALVVVAGALGCGVVAALVITRMLMPAFRWLDTRVGLPRPRSALGRYTCFVLLPVGVPLVAMTVAYGHALGAQTEPVWLVALLLVEGAMLYAWQPLSTRLLEGAKSVSHAWTLVGALAVLAATVALFKAQPKADEAARKGPVAHVAVQMLRNLTDIDHDGSSSLYGGRDCAPTSNARHPNAYDIPNNGIDENCDGVDAVARAGAPELRTFMGDLEPTGLKAERYNIVWVVVDATRADRCSLYGHAPKTTPFLETLTKESLVFTEAYSQSSATMLSIPSMLTGRNPGALDWVKNRRLELGEQNTTLAERLQKEGYRTGIVADKYIKKNLGGMLQGYDVVEDTWLDGNRMPWYRRDAAVAMTLAIKILESQRDSEAPFFLTVYSADPHDPYERHTSGFPDFGREPIERYDSEIAFADRYTGVLVDYLRYNRPLWDKTIFIFTSDHGEEFGEHGGVRHAYTCYEESTHVPLLVRVPHLRGRRVRQRVALTDIVPTLLELIGVDAGDMTLDGQSLLLPAFEPRAVANDRPVTCAVLSQKAKQGDFFRQSVRAGHRALMHDRVANTFEYYDVAKDRGETKNLIQVGDKAAVARLKDILERDLSGNLRGMRLFDP